QAGPAYIINVGDDPDIAHAIAHTIKRAKPARTVDESVESLIALLAKGRDAAPTPGAKIKPRSSPAPATSEELPGTLNRSPKASRADSLTLKSVAREVSSPTTGIAVCCARTASEQAATARKVAPSQSTMPRFPSVFPYLAPAYWRGQ